MSGKHHHVMCRTRPHRVGEGDLSPLCLICGHLHNESSFYHLCGIGMFTSDPVLKYWHGMYIILF